MREIKAGSTVMLVKSKDLKEDHGCIFVVKGNDDEVRGRVQVCGGGYILCVWPKFLLVFPPLDDLLDATDEMVQRVGPAPRI